MSFGLDRVAERKIAEAVEAGKFDDLAGKGRPLVIDEDPLTPPHLRLGNRILKNANVLPDRVQIEVEIRQLQAECESLWGRIAADYQKWNEYARREGTEAARQRFAEWHGGARSRYIGALKRHNDVILKHNLAAPNSPSVYFPYKVREMIRRFDEAFPAPTQVQPSPGREESESRGVLRESTAALYRAGLLKRDG